MNKGVLLAFFLAGALTGCVVEPGYEEDQGYDEFYDPGPDIFLFGIFEHGHGDREEGHRGAESRREAHHSERPGDRPGGHEREPSHGSPGGHQPEPSHGGQNRHDRM